MPIADLPIADCRLRSPISKLDRQSAISIVNQQSKNPQSPIRIPQFCGPYRDPEDLRHMSGSA